MHFFSESYELSDWYSHYEEKYNDLMYNDVNLGSILQSELINILVNFIKNFYVIYKITKKYDFLASIGEEDLEFFTKIYNHFHKINLLQEN